MKFNHPNLFLIPAWALVIFILGTVQFRTVLVLFQLGSVEYWVLLGLFLLSSLSLFNLRRFTFLSYVHVAVMLTMFLARVRSRYIGVDGCLIIIAVYLFSFMSVRRMSAQWRLLLASLLLGLVISNQVVGVAERLKSKQGNISGELDYVRWIGPDGPAGFLRPHLNHKIWAETPNARVRTDANGFRTLRDDVSPGRKSPNYRIVFLGDSFVAGLRTDQELTVGRILENELNSLSGAREFEVLIAGHTSPWEYERYVRNHLFHFKPDMLIVGITIGNDIAQTTIAKRKGDPRIVHEVQSALLPMDAYETRIFPLLLTKAKVSAKQWKVFKLVIHTFFPYGIFSWNLDSPQSVHQVDISHGLGNFYSRAPLPLIEMNFEDTLACISQIYRMCQAEGVRFVVLLFPQRFQVSCIEWAFTQMDFALSPASFDLDLPNKKIIRYLMDRHIPICDPTPALRKIKERLFFPLGDMHMNTLGQYHTAIYLKDFLQNNVIPKTIIGNHNQQHQGKGDIS